MPSAQPAFFRNLQALGAVAFNRGKAHNQLDPLSAAKDRFAATADAQLKLIESAAAKGLWFTREGESLIVTLKNGITAINPEAPTFALANSAQAIKFIKAAKDACAKGEFDTLLLATNRGRRRKPSVDTEGGDNRAVELQAPIQAIAGKRSEK